MRNRWLVASWLALAGCAVQGPAASPGSPGPSSEAHALEVGRQAARDGDSVRAEQYLVSALDQGHDEAEVVVELVLTCVRDNRLRSAIRYAAPFVRRHPEAADLRFLLATLYTAVGEPGAALEQVELLLATQPAHAAGQFLAATLLRTRQPERARSHATRYLALEPRGAHAAEARALVTAADLSQPVSVRDRSEGEVTR